MSAKDSNLVPHKLGAAIARHGTFPRDLVFSISYLTDEAALRALLPEGFSPHGEPMLNFRYRFSDQLDWGLNSTNQAVGVSVPCQFTRDGQVFAGVHWLALWEDDYWAVIVGREMMGVAKLGGQIFHQTTPDGAHLATLSEAGRALISLNFETEAEIQGADLESLRTRGKSNLVLGWKQIPDVRNEKPLLSHPTVYAHTLNMHRAWKGVGEAELMQVDPKVNVWSTAILDKLRTLPLLENRGAILFEGSAKLGLAEGREFPR